MNDKRRKNAIKTIGKILGASEEINNKTLKALTRELEKYGRPIVPVILEELLKVKTNGLLKVKSRGYSQSVSRLMIVVEELARPEDAGKIAEMLLWKEILSEQYRPVRGIILEVLQKIGNDSIIPSLQRYAEIIPDIEYKGNHIVSAVDFHEWDMIDVNGVINKLNSRFVN